MRRLIILGLFLALLFGCSREMPVEKDGSFLFEAVIADTSGILNADPDDKFISLKNAEVLLEYGAYYKDFENPKRKRLATDADGFICFDDLAAGDYTVSIRKDTFYVDASSGNPIAIELTGYKQIEITGPQERPDTLFTNISIKASVVINEIYYCGPVNRAFYFYDQFVELANTTDETVYLDGMILCRARQYRHPDIDTNDFLQAIYVYQFPGTPGVTTECPLEPGAITVVAADAFDHSAYIETAADLSMAEWEFYNPYGAEPDNPAKNVTNIFSDHRTDFMINVSHNAVILAYSSNPSDPKLRWYFGEFKDSGSGQYVHIPLQNVVDAVEYSSSVELQKEITIRQDAGFAGVGITKYSGKSVERRTKGFDTNNSSLDFINLDAPTPGYQHK